MASLTKRFLESCRSGDVKEVTSLLQRGVEIHSATPDNTSALSLSIIHEYPELTELLLKHGANVNLSNNFGQTPLHFACLTGAQSIVQSLINKGANVNALNRYKETPLHTCGTHGYKDIFHLLLKSGADIKIKNRQDQTALHIVKNVWSTISTKKTDDKKSKDSDEMSSGIFGELFV